MNKLMPGKGKAVFCLILTCLFLAQACKKDLLAPNSNDLQNGLSIAEAKAYFDVNLRQSNKREKLMSTSVSHGVTVADIMNNKQPIWDRAYSRLIAEGKVVKIPIDFGETMATIGAKKHLLPYSSLNYLFMYRDSLEKIHAEWVELRPDSAWLFGSRADYTGSIILKDWNGDFLKKMDYGLKTSSLNTTLRSKMSSSLSPPIKIASNSTPFKSEKCIRVRVSNQCTCPDKSKCDYCLEWCAVELCWDEPICPDCDNSGNTGGSNNNGGNNGNNGNNGPNGPGSAGSGGSPNPGAYPPENCTNGPQVVYPDGSMTAPPCIGVPTEGGGLPPATVNPTPAVLAPQFLINTLSLSGSEANFVNEPTNSLVVGEIATYLITNGIIENQELAKQMIKYMMANNGVSFEDLLSGDYDHETVFPPDIETGNFVELSIDNSDTRIVISPQDMVKYPKFTALVKGLYNRVASSPKIIAALVKYTGFTQTSILNDLKFDKRGPIIWITPKEQLKTYNPKTKTYGYPYGRCISDDVNKHYIFLNKEFIDLLEAANGANSDALVTILAVTILHEYVHWSDNNFGLSPSLPGEMGDLFEKDAYGGVVQYNKKNGKTYYRKQ